MQLFKVMTLSLLVTIGLNVHAGEVKTSLNGLTLNGDLVMADGKNLKDGIVLFTHGTWMHNNYSTATMLKNNLPYIRR